MFFITKKDSETGKKMAELVERIKRIRLIQKEKQLKYGFKEFTDDYEGIGRIGWVRFNELEIPNKKLWKIIAPKHRGYGPRTNTREGEELRLEIAQMPFISNSEINEITNPTLPPWNRIGFTQNNGIFGFKTFDSEFSDPNWKYPADCEEVTETRYWQLFPKPEKHN